MLSLRSLETTKNYGQNRIPSWFLTCANNSNCALFQSQTDSTFWKMCQRRRKPRSSCQVKTEKEIGNVRKRKQSRIHLWFLKARQLKKSKTDTSKSQELFSRQEVKVSMLLYRNPLIISLKKEEKKMCKNFFAEQKKTMSWRSSWLPKLRK
jgi:hypothetical protein